MSNSNNSIIRTSTPNIISEPEKNYKNNKEIKTRNNKYRSRFVKLFDLGENFERVKAFDKVFATFCTASFAEAAKILFGLMYGEPECKEEQLNKLGCTMEQSSSKENVIFLKEEEVQPFAYELRYQYQVKHPSFLKFKEDPRYKDELDALKKRMSNDPLLFFRAAECCSKVCRESSQAKYCLNLLGSAKENEQFNGLRNMGHNKCFANLLKPYAKEIHELLQAMVATYEDEQKVISAAACSNPSGSTPFAGLAKAISGQGYTLADDVNVDEDEPVQSLDFTLKTRLYLANREVLWNYLNSPNMDNLKKLRNAGIDVNEVLDSEDLIKKLLLANDMVEHGQNRLEAENTKLAERQKAFDEATAKLAESQKAFDEVKAMLAKCKASCQSSKKELAECQAALMAVQKQMS